MFKSLLIKSIFNNHHSKNCDMNIQALISELSFSDPPSPPKLNHDQLLLGVNNVTPPQRKKFLNEASYNTFVSPTIGRSRKTPNTYSPQDVRDFDDHHHVAGNKHLCAPKLDVVAETCQNQLSRKACILQESATMAIMERWVPEQFTCHKGIWSNEEDELLRHALDESTGTWQDISRTYFEGYRTAKECEERWQEHLRPDTYCIVAVGGRMVMQKIPRKSYPHVVESSSSASSEDTNNDCSGWDYWLKPEEL